MNFIWVFLIGFIINVTKAKDLVANKIKSDGTKVLKPPLYQYIITKRRTIGLFPTMPNMRNKYMVNLKPLTDTYNQATKLEQYKNPLMRTLPIKDINYNSDDRVRAEITTRRSLMQTKKFTVRPHDVYAESVREKYNWNSKRTNYNPRIPKHERNIAKTYSKTNREESRFLNYKSNDTSINNKDFFESKKRDNQNSYVQDLRKLKNAILFPKRNNSRYFKENPVQSISKEVEINKLISESKIPSHVVNNGDGVIIEEKESITVPPNVFIKSNSKDQIDEIIKPKDNNYDLKENDQDEFISAKGVIEIPLKGADFADDVEITTDSDIDYLVSRPKRSVNIIEEENIATTFAGIKITDQDYPISHDLTFKNIHT